MELHKKWNCTILAFVIATALGVVDIHAACENAQSNAELWPGDVKFSYSTVICKGKVEEKIISETSELIDSVTVPCSVTQTMPTITKTITTGASATLSVSGTLTLGASATAEAGIAGFGKVGGTTSVSSSVTVGADGTISSTDSVSVTCKWTVPPCLNWKGEMRQEVKEFTTNQKITQCTKRTIAALPGNPARVGESVLRGPVKTATVTIEGNVRRGKSCSDMILGPCPDKKDGTGIPQESVTESGEKPDDDQDGSPNDEENYRGTDPYNPDTDEDGLFDSVDPCPLDPDCDGDSIEDGSEVTGLNTDPQNPDSDDDGILDSKDVFPTLNPNPTINLYDVFPSGNVTGIGSSGREVLISGIIEPFPPVLEVVVGDNLMVAFPTDKEFSLAPIELPPGSYTVNFYAVSGNGETANREPIDSVDFQLQEGGPCLFCQGVVDDVLDLACYEFSASPPTSETKMMDTIVEIFNGVLLNNSVCDDGQPNGGSAAACTAYLLNLVGITQVAPGPQPAPGVRVRKEVHAMTVEERTLYIETYRQAYDDVDSGLQELIDRETMFFSRGLHNNGAFLPWHRGYLLEVENILREFNPHVTVPYWNWSLQPRISEDSIWGDGPDQFSGNGDSNRCVMDGTFGWNSGFRLTNGNCLQRRLSGGRAASSANVDVLINRYPQPWQYDSFRNRLEHGPGLHDSVHCLVGGTMCSSRSANDPVFVLHHANIDRIWARWQAQSEEHRAAYSGSTAVDNFMPASPYTPGELLDLRFQPSGVAGEFIEIRYEAEEAGYSQ